MHIVIVLFVLHTQVQYPSVAKHLRLVVEWRDERICERVREPPETLRDESLRGLDEVDGEVTVPVDLNDCLSAYFSEELVRLKISDNNNIVSNCPVTYNLLRMFYSLSLV